MGFDYFDDFTDTFIVQNDFVAPSSVKPGKIIFLSFEWWLLVTTNFIAL
ncbi:hypothetical protein [Aerococcus sp. L_32]